MSTNNGLRVLFIANGVFVLAGSLLGPLYAVYAEGIAHSPIAISLSWSAFLVSTTVFTYIIGKIGDRFREREYLLMAGFLVRAFAWASYIFVGDIAMLVAVQILLGFGEALGSPAFLSLFSDHLDQGKSVSSYSSWIIIASLINAMGTLAGGTIATYLGFPALFITMAFLAVIAFLYVLFQPRSML